MKAVVFHGVGDIRLESVPEPKIQQPDDVIVRITSSAICGTDLHFIRGTVPGIKRGRILGHEAVGVVAEVGKSCRSLRPGDRVVVPSTVGCGSCNYCRAGYYSQCNKANPNGPLAGTVFFGGPEENGGLDGLQAEYARIPFAAANLLKLPDEVTDDQAILMSDILPTSYQAAEMAEIRPSVSVAIFGAGPVGMLAIACAKHLGAGRVFVVDQVESRLEMARSHGAETINFAKEDPVEVLRELTEGSGPDRVIDAVGVDATSAGASEKENRKEFAREMEQVDPEVKKAVGKWWIGDAPSQALQWAVASVAKAGTVSIIGVYPPGLKTFPIGEFMNKNLRMNAGNCHHRRYLPMLIELVRSGVFRTEQFLTQKEPIVSAIDAYHTFDNHQDGWLKVKLDPQAQ
jgi:threonine dehydrogenase-like Zn-dependent dehydrogenase